MTDDQGRMIFPFLTYRSFKCDAPVIVIDFHIPKIKNTLNKNKNYHLGF